MGLYRCLVGFYRVIWGYTTVLWGYTELRLQGSHVAYVPMLPSCTDSADERRLGVFHFPVTII